MKQRVSDFQYIVSQTWRGTGRYSSPNRNTSAPRNEPKSLALGRVADRAMNRIREAGRPLETTLPNNNNERQVRYFDRIATTMKDRLPEAGLTFAQNMCSYGSCADAEPQWLRGRRAMLYASTYVIVSAFYTQSSRCRKYCLPKAGLGHA